MQNALSVTARDAQLVRRRKIGAVLVYRYTGEFLLFSYPYMELWRSSLMFRSFVYRYTRTQPKNFSSNTTRGKNFRTAPYYYKINLFPQWQCIVFVIVFSIQELNARCRMGLCGNFTLSESTHFHVFFVVFVLFNVLLVVLLHFLIYMFVVFIYFVANSTGELEDIRVDSNINNVTVRGKFSCLQFMTTGTCD